MTEPTRRQQIEAMLVDDPQDLFLRYGLALELDKEGEHEPCLELLRGLMGETPPYVPAFFMAGQYQAKLGHVEASRSALRDGIEQARAQGNTHAAGEMAEFLATLGSFDA